MLKKVEIIPQNLEDYDNLLQNKNLDFVGTRLHGGIRAMQKEHRTIIISIDNRAKEMAENYNINIVDRDKIEEIENVINSEWYTEINLPYDNIKEWINQFNKK